MKSRFVLMFVVVHGLFAVCSARAATNGFVVPPFRGSENSQAGYWEIFSTAVGAPGNLPDSSGSTTGALLTQISPTAFLTGSGNIYNLDNASEFSLSNTTPFILGTVVLQTRTLGTELDYDSMTLSYDHGSGAAFLAALPRVVLNRGEQPGLGATVSMLWQWNLTGLNVSNYTISFRASGASTSFDSVTLDTASQFSPLFTAPFQFTNSAPIIERWLYANNADPCGRPAGSSFGVLGDDSGVDTRIAQHLIGWNTESLLPTNRGPANYLITHCRVTLTVNRGNAFVYDPSHDYFPTYFETNHPAYVSDADVGRPVELFGVGYRNGFDAVSFDQCAELGSDGPGERNAYATSWSTNGVLVDIANNVGKTNSLFPPFEAIPFAVGQTTNVAAGQSVPVGAKITFDLNLSDPLVLTYLQSGLDSGQLRFMISSLHLTGGQFGGVSYPDFVTRFNEAVVDPTKLELRGVVAGLGDLDGDTLPDDWEIINLHGLTDNAASDTDKDGRSNLAELGVGSDPASTNSTLRILSMTNDALGRASLRYPYFASRTNVVEFTDNLTASWSPLTNAPIYELEAGTAVWVDETASPTNRFYRVRSNLP